MVTFTKLDTRTKLASTTVKQNKIYTPTVVKDALLSPALRSLLLLLLFDLGGLGLNFASTGERAVNYFTETQVNSENKFIIVNDSGKNDLFPYCLEVGVLEDVGGDEKIATVQSLPTLDKG